MDHGEIVGLALGPQFLEDRKVRRLALGETASHLCLAAHEQMMKGADRPFLRGVASVTDATILGDRLESLALPPPAEDVPLVNGVQGVDENQRAGNRDTGFAQ